MESVSALSSPAPLVVNGYNPQNINLTILQSSLSPSSNPDSDAATVDINPLTGALGLSAEEIVAKLNELLAGKLPPEGIAALKAEETSPESTAERIVRQVTAIFDSYSKQRGDEDQEKVLESFMKAVRSGVEQGYQEAFDILEGLGAFKFDGVQSGVEQTKILIESKLQAFEDSKRKQFELSPTRLDQQVSLDLAATSAASVLQGAGAALNVVA